MPELMDLDPDDEESDDDVTEDVAESAEAELSKSTEEICFEYMS
jgi:hypothetical protein